MEVNVKISEKFPGVPSTVASIFIFVTVLQSFVAPAKTLRLTNMTAPLVQDPRKDMHLYCEFDMGTEDLYAVKWYKDDQEFFRYRPEEEISRRLVEFPVAGVKVNMADTKCRGQSCFLALHGLKQGVSSGAYRCEVSSEAPAFRLASQTHNVTVAVLSDVKPVIEGLSDQPYIIGDLLIATCTSGKGDPKPTLTWYINKQQVLDKLVKEVPQRPGLYEKDNLKSTVLQIRLPLDRKFAPNKLTTHVELSCESHVEGISAAIAPHLSLSKTIVVTTEQQAKNQMLYGMFSSNTGVIESHWLLSLLGLVTVVGKQILWSF